MGQLLFRIIPPPQRGEVMFVKMWQSEHEIFFSLLLLLPWLNLELKMHVILNFRSLERAVNKYEIKCLLKCCCSDVNWIETLTLFSLGGLQKGGRVTRVASQVKSLRVGPYWLKQRGLQENCRSEHRLEEGWIWSENCCRSEQILHRLEMFLSTSTSLTAIAQILQLIVFKWKYNTIPDCLQ